jgi:short-subunit dehydrogenase
MTRYAMITGASSGLGLALAEALARRGRNLILVARREPLMTALADRIRAEFPHVGVSVFAVDLASDVARNQLLAEIDALGIVPDLLVNNAGLGDYGEFSTSDWPRLEAMLKVNVEALTHLTHAMVPRMIRAGRGAAIQVSSLASLLPIPDFAVYAATKAYVTSFSEALRIELREHGIPVIALCPGPVRTGFGQVARRSENGREMPGHKAFYVAREQVVAEALTALEADRARVYPGLKIAVAAAAISLLPIVLIRAVMGMRPRKP